VRVGTCFDYWLRENPEADHRIPDHQQNHRDLTDEGLSVPKTPSIGFAIAGESEHDCWMFAIAFLFVRVLCDCFKSRRRLEAEVLVVGSENSIHLIRDRRRIRT